MKRIIGLLAVLVCLSFGAQATVLTFEDLSGSAALPSNYGGVTWSSGWHYYDNPQPPYTPASGIVRIYNHGAQPSFSFVSPTVFDGAYFSGYQGSIQFELWYGGGMVATSGSISPNSTPTFLASGYAGLVDEVRLLVTNPGYFIMDDVTFGGSAIPEPSTFGLLGVGLAGVLFAVRRRNIS